MRLIDADALKNHYSWWEGGTKENTLDEQKEIFDTIVDLQPTIDPVKHGKWETKPFYGKDFKEVPNHVWCRCPFCKNELGVFEKGNYYQFCPVCGARLGVSDD